MSRKITQQEFVQEMAEKHPTLEVVGTYEGRSKPVSIRCKVCGHPWDPLPNNLINNGSGCPSCANNLPKTDERFRAELAEKNPSVEPLEPYPGNNKTPMRFRCKECGHSWPTSAQSALQGHICKHCASSKANEANKLTQDEFVKRVASANPNVEILGDYSSSHEGVRARCKVCGCEWKPIAWNLIYGSRCPKCDASSKTSFFERAIFHAFQKALGEGEVLDRDKSAVGMELDIYIPSLATAIEPGSWYWHANGIGRDARKRELCEQKGIRCITIYDSFDPKASENPFGSDCLTFESDLGLDASRMELRELIEDLALMMDVRLAFDQSDWEEIEAKATEQASLNDQTFRERMAEVRPDLTIVGTYTSYTTPVAMRCSKGHDFRSKPRELLSGCGCQKCANERTGARTRLSQEEFVARMANAQPDIEVLGLYTGMTKKVLVRCTSCGKEWSPRAYDILRKGHKCKSGMR